MMIEGLQLIVIDEKGRQIDYLTNCDLCESIIGTISLVINFIMFLKSAKQSPAARSIRSFLTDDVKARC